MGLKWYDILAKKDFPVDRIDMVQSCVRPRWCRGQLRIIGLEPGKEFGFDPGESIKEVAYFVE